MPQNVPSENKQASQSSKSKTVKPKTVKPKTVKPKNTSSAGSVNKTARVRKPLPNPTVRAALKVGGSPVFTPEEMKARIASRAYELYQLRGEHHGNDLDDWLEAEAQVYAEHPIGRH